MEIITKGDYKITCVNCNDIIYFKARDVASMLGYKNPKEAIRMHVSLDNVFKWSNIGGGGCKRRKNCAFLYAILRLLFQ
jgi:prophage antirepressor-like protein